MVWSLCIELENDWFHVMARGLEWRRNFWDEANRRHWLELLDEVHAPYPENAFVIRSISPIRHALEGYQDRLWQCRHVNLLFCFRL